MQVAAQPFQPSFGASKPKRSNSRGEQREGEENSLQKLDEVPEKVAEEQAKPDTPLQK